MVRVHQVKAGQRDYTCGRCREVIPAGTPRFWWKKRYGAKQARCLTCGRPRQSELMGGHAGTLCALGEVWGDTTKATIEDYESALRAYAEGVEEVAEALTESADNIVEGFGHEVPMSEELMERAGCLCDWSAELESAADEVEALLPEDWPEWPASNAALTDQQQADLDQWLLDQAEELAEGAAGGSPE